MRAHALTPEDVVPAGLPLSTDQVSALPEGSTVLAVLPGHTGAEEFVVHREGGRIYARSKVDVAGGVIDRQKVLTFVTRVWLAQS